LPYVLLVMALLLSIHALLRLAFVVYNSSQAHALPWSDFFLAMLVGLRYDVATVLMFNGALFLLLSLPIGFARHLLTYRLMSWLVLLVNFPSFVVNAVDIIYYSYAEKRLTHELFTTGTDLLNFDPVEYTLEFWPVILFFLAMTATAMWLLRRLRLFVLKGPLPSDNPRSLRAWLMPLAYLVVMIIGVRGGLQRQWLNPTMAFVSSNFFAGNVGLNSAFTVIYARDKSEMPLALMPEEEAVQTSRSLLQNEFDVEWHSAEYPLYRRTSFDVQPRRLNVVILLIESLNADLLSCMGGSTPTPTLDSLARAGRLYTHFFANGSRSVEAQPAVFNSLPDIFTRPTIGSHYSANRHRGLAHILGEQGYATAYFHGGENGVLGLEEYSKVSGFGKYYGVNEFPDAEKYHDGLWGVFDEPFLQWMVQEQGKLEQPFFTAYFSCTNHHPFPLPDKGAEDLKAMNLTPQQRTVIYTDRSLRTYFTEARKQPWFDSTLFVLTGDHCFYLESDPNRTMPDQFHVPLILCGPGIEPGQDPVIGSQVCIQPTLIDHLRISTWHASAGVSLLRARPEPFALNNLMGVVSFSQTGNCLSTRFSEDFSASQLEQGKWKTLTTPTLMEAKTHAEMDRKLRSLYQTLQHCRVENRFVPVK
jgi:uncharacterized sulfatase